MSNVKLSASRIKTYESCSWKYYCNYLLKLPSSSNDGAKRGDTVHRVLECLLKPHRKNKVEILLQDVRGVPAVNRMVSVIAKQNGVDDKEHIDLIYKFIYTALKSDFYCDGGIIQPPEYEFRIGDPNEDGYFAMGFIDKYAVYPEQKFISIRDYKTSKTAFKQSELQENVQALMYSLAMHKAYPDFESEVQFIFLKFPKDPIRKISFTKNQLAGFEEYLKSVYSTLSQFSYKEAQAHFAAEDMLWKMHCGTAEYPGELKDDGITPKHCCTYKFPFIYYAVVDDEGNNLRTAYSIQELSPKENEIVMKKKYGGCPFWKRKLGF